MRSESSACHIGRESARDRGISHAVGRKIHERILSDSDRYVGVGFLRKAPPAHPYGRGGGSPGRPVRISEKEEREKVKG